MATLEDMKARKQALLETQRDQREQELFEYDMQIEQHQIALELLPTTAENEGFRSQLQGLVDGNTRERLKVATWLGAINQQLDNL